MDTVWLVCAFDYDGTDITYAFPTYELAESFAAYLNREKDPTDELEALFEPMELCVFHSVAKAVAYYEIETEEMHNELFKC